jgi:hypothetical protein
VRWLVAICLLLLAAPAEAASADTKALKRLGVSLRWPAATTGAPGDVVTVKVRSERRRVQVSLVTGGRTLARRTLRNGTFRARLGGPGTYALRAVVGKRRYSLSEIIVPAPPPVRPAPDPCLQGTGTSASLSLSSSAARAGETLTLSLTNTSDGCLYTGVGYRVEQFQPDGSWTLVNTDQIFVTLAVIVRPGETYTKTVPLPAGLSPGRYRISDAAFGAHDIRLSAPFEIVP